MFDMGRAWNTATGMIGKNRDMILVVAGVFFFLPYFATTLLLPQAMTPEVVDPEDYQAVIAVIQQTYIDYWWVMLIIYVMQGIGTLALLALLTDWSRPTLGDALKRGAVFFPSYFAANILVTLIAVGIIALPVGLGIASGVAVIVILAVMLAIPLVFYLMVKFSLIMPAIAVDGILNPFQALARSWQLTRGNSLRLFLFYFLLLVVTVVIFLLATLVLGVVFAAVGGEVELIGNGIVSSLLNAGFVVIFLAVLAAVHRQLAGERPEELSQTFE